MNFTQAIRALHLSGKPVCIHASMRSFGQRADGLLDAFLQEGCTVLAPTFSDMFEAPPVPEYMPPQNGAGDYSYFFGKEYTDAGSYSPDRNDVTVEEMGVFPQLLLAHPARTRGNNFLNSFAAAGPLAHELTDGQTNRDVYAPLARLYQLDGCVLLMGVDLTSATAVHYAEQLAGRQPFIRWAKDACGNTVPVRAGGCSEGFEKFAPLLRPFETQITVGNSLWRCFRIRDLVDTCAAAFQKNPRIAHCGDPDCSRCNDAALGGPITDNDI